MPVHCIVTGDHICDIDFTTDRCTSYVKQLIHRASGIDPNGQRLFAGVREILGQDDLGRVLKDVDRVLLYRTDPRLQQAMMLKESLSAGDATVAAKDLDFLQDMIPELRRGDGLQPDVVASLLVFSVEIALMPGVVQGLERKLLNFQLVALEALAAMGDSAAHHSRSVAGLLDAQNFRRVWPAACFALRKMGAAQDYHAAKVLQSIGGGHAEVLESLVALGASAQLATLLDSDHDVYIRARACECLGSLSSDVAAPYTMQVVGLLQDYSHLGWVIRIAACEFFGKTGIRTEECLEGLTTCFCDENPNVREAAGRALVGLEARKELQLYADANDSGVRGRALRGLQELDGR